MTEENKIKIQNFLKDNKHKPSLWKLFIIWLKQKLKIKIMNKATMTKEDWKIMQANYEYDIKEANDYNRKKLIEKFNSNQNMMIAEILLHVKALRAREEYISNLEQELNTQLEINQQLKQDLDLKYELFINKDDKYYLRRQEGELIKVISIEELTQKTK